LQNDPEAVFKRPPARSQNDPEAVLAIEYKIFETASKTGCDPFPQTASPNFGTRFLFGRRPVLEAVLKRIPIRPGMTRLFPKRPRTLAFHCPRDGLPPVLRAVILGDAVFTKNDTVDGEQVDERSSVGTDNSDLGDECIDPLHAEASCNITNSVGTENYSMLTTVARARSEPLLKWQSILAVLLSCGTVKFTVEKYETLRGTLIWKSSQLGATRKCYPDLERYNVVLFLLCANFRLQSQRLSCLANSSIAQDRLVWFFLASGLSLKPVPAPYTRPCSAVIYMERKSLYHISCLTALRTLQSSFPDGEPSQPLNAFSSMPNMI
jgi:hypothetical protein